MLKVEQVNLSNRNQSSDIPPLEESIHRMQLEITNDVLAGRVPKTCATFRELHDHVDANEYGGFCDDGFFDKMIEHFGGRGADERIPEGMIDYLNKAQNAINQWILTGALLKVVSNKTDGLMRVHLASVGNPDHGQNPESSLHGVVDSYVIVDSLKSASEQCRNFINENALGAGNWSGGDITRDGIVIANVSYNGCVRNAEGLEISL